MMNSYDDFFEQQIRPLRKIQRTLEKTIVELQALLDENPNMEGDYREYILHALFATKNSKHNGEKIIAELFEELNIDQDPDGGYIPCKFQQEKGDK